ncbi:BREX-1 system phosphatase PglZ type B [Nitrosococcus wardiae]|uniref:BREX-1 system phosphatase PglZ type B n=1 Tax=Nitrosococcus wardiae TaxID=1814290 RepID=A0A4V1AVJ6_9GAMM|nr:BREX-1 system phosphatase PglZ type B [Nitrosococcus wardiae]QBQ53365.1 BREX-1 system phosphatase PglZ type B [Nitrosococcus wardiae]
MQYSTYIALPTTTVIEALVRALESAAKYNPNDVVQPAAILWTDHDSQWQPIIPQLRRLMPQLLTLGEYAPEHRTGPAIWLRSVVDRALENVEISQETTPIVYLPGISRQELRAVQECPDHLKPLVELQYRGVCWTQKNGKDWTVEAFLVSEEGGLGLNVARDAATRRAMLGALAELATTSLERLRGKYLEAEDFDKLFSDDPAKDLLLWLSDSEMVKSGWKEGRWNAFKSRCKTDFKFDPDKDGELVAAELLGKQEGAWARVWERFAEAPALYPGVPELLGKAMPDDLFVELSSWPQKNEEQEVVLRQALLNLEKETPAAACEQILALEKTHGERRHWVWAKLDLAPLANALAPLAFLAERTSSKLGGGSVSDMAKQYVDEAWEVDAAALSAMAAVKSSVDVQALCKALNAIYRPWLESAAEHLQALVEKEPLPGYDGQGLEDILVDSGGLIFFADGLRFDVSQRLAERMRAKGWSVTLSTRWAGLPTVTATAKPAVSPVTRDIKGLDLGEDFLPATADGGQPLTTDRFRKLLAAAGYPYLGSDEAGDPSGRAWTENGELDKLGHALQGKLVGRIEEQVELLIERIQCLLDTGWREIRIVTDHGWLWLPGGLPKVDLPKYLTASRWARCAAIKGGSKVEVPTVQWHWNSDERVAVAPGIACFGAGNEYAHGGLSLQESLIPVIRVTAGEAVGKTAAKVVDVSWAGLRCRVQIEAVQLGLFVDLRTKVNDPSSSISKVRSADSKGTASLLVIDEELEGMSAAVVVLDASGYVITKQSTIIGGED